MRQTIFPRLRWRVLSVVVGALVAVGVAAGVALAKTRAAPIGTGVVVIETGLGYAGGSAAGTGMVLTSSGEVLTNNHVIRGATSIRVVVPGSGRSYTAKVVGYDVADDVALLQAVGAANLKTVSTSTAKLSIGDKVTAVGNAGGTGTLTSATGTITGLQQSVVVSDDQGGAERLTGLIATDAGVQPGDSGGPLLNGAARVVGMDTAGSIAFAFRPSAATQAFAIPIAKALSIAKQIEAGRSSARVHVGATPFLGVQVAASVGRFGGYPSPGGLLAGVVSGGPADAAGLEPGDVITAIDGKAISSPTSITSALLTKKPGAKVTIAYDDEFGASHEATVRLASGPAQ